MILINTFILSFILGIINLNSKAECQEKFTNTVIELNRTYVGSMNEDDSYRYFMIVIPNEIEKNVHNLIFRVQEPEAARQGKDDFSDPDIYISTVKF